LRGIVSTCFSDETLERVLIRALVTRQESASAPRALLAATPALEVAGAVDDRARSSSPRSRRRQPRQLLKWAGSKASMLGQLLPRTPASFAAYHEPFVGSGAV
jgi:hypothetical protein